jgi:Protein of unknown function (DUF3617)
MAKKIQVLLLVAVLVLCSSPVLASPDVQEGSWEITVVSEMSGMTLPPQKHTQCLKSDALVPADPQMPQGCVIKDQRVSGNTVSWTMECSTEGAKTVSTGSITYEGESFSGTMDVTISGTDMKVVNTMSGRRLGPCK